MPDKIHALWSPSDHRLEPLRNPHRLGAHVRRYVTDGHQGRDVVGVEFAVVASHASAVDLVLLDADPSTPGGFSERAFALAGPVQGVWHGFAPGVRAGQRYGFRVHGKWSPDDGLRHNPAKLLLDPYARAIVGDFQLVPEIYGHVVDEEFRPTVRPLVRDVRDSAPFVQHAVVTDLAAHPLHTRRPEIAWEDTVIYEAHVRGLTMNLPGVPEHLRGTYAGLAHPATIEHLRSLGVTSIELLPIHAMASEPHLLTRGLSNYWGYNTLGFFAPNPHYATQQARDAGPLAVLDEVRGMVKLLHDAGLEVLLDVVYNHTCEGGNDGPSLSWRGLDNSAYYAHDGGWPANLADVTGCGNTLDFRRSRVVQMTLDSLRYWAQEIGIDGYRFDLAVSLARGEFGFDSRHPLLMAMRTDPVLSGLKLIAEPWDVGPGGWRTGQFPPPMAEWNDRFRNAVRSFWLSDVASLSHGATAGGVRELATRLSGSADLFGGGTPPGTRGPIASINFITAHDGFTLADLVSYDHKHNSANGEDNRDGTNDNRSWNHGIEGPVGEGLLAGTISELRHRSVRNLAATLILAAGVPMITAGDEICRTQNGNNNPYCQDNEISWIDWDIAPWQGDILDTFRHLLALRRRFTALRPTSFYTGKTMPDGGADLAWFRADGAPMEHGDWLDPTLRTVSMLRSGVTGPPVGMIAPGDDADILVVLHGGLDPIEVTLPKGTREAEYELLWDSDWSNPAEGHASAEAEGCIHVMAGHQAILDPLTVRLYARRGVSA